MRLGLTALKMVYISGRLTGIPVPDVEGAVGDWINGQLGELSDLVEGATKYLSEHADDDSLAKGLPDTLNDNAQNAINEQFEAIKPLDGEVLGNKHMELLSESCNELDGLHSGNNPDWKNKCGLVLATSKDGTSEYVLEKDKEYFNKGGQDLLSASIQQSNLLPVIPPTSEINKIIITVVKGGGFQATKKRFKQDIPDVYCKVKYGSNEWETVHVKNNNAPVWMLPYECEHLITKPNQELSIDV